MKRPNKTPLEARGYRVIVLGLLTSLALAPAALAKKPDNPGNGGGGDSGDPGGDPVGVPLAETPPVDYEKTELRWAGSADPTDPDNYDDRQPGHIGTLVTGVNAGGRVVGLVKAASTFRYGVVNALTPEGEPTGLLVDLNTIFEAPDGWRIAYAQGINDDGLVACQLIPEAEPLWIEGSPLQFAIADLGTGEMTLVGPEETSPEHWQYVIEMTEDGHLLVQGDILAGADGLTEFEHYIYARQTDGSYVRRDLPGLGTPGVTDWNPSINNALQIASSDAPERSTLYEWNWDGSAQTYEPIPVWHGYVKTKGRNTDDDDFFVRGISNLPDDGGPAAIYASLYSADGNDQASGIYRITGGGRELIAAGPSLGSPASTRNLSRADYGREEILLLDTESGDYRYQIYQPEFGMRFRLPGDVVEQPYQIRDVTISTPSGPIGPEDYHGGYIAYFVWGEPTRSFVLTPVAP